MRGAQYTQLPLAYGLEPTECKPLPELDLESEIWNVSYNASNAKYALGAIKGRFPKPITFARFSINDNTFLLMGFITMTEVCQISSNNFA